MQAAHHMNADLAAQPAMPFLSKSAHMSAALNALAQPVPIRDSSSLGFNHSTDIKVIDRISGVPTSAGVVTLLTAFRTTGGVVLSDKLAMMLEYLKIGDAASLGRAMASGDICSFQWRSAFWIPMFQFDLENLSFKHGPRSILRELRGVFDEWMLTAWFAQPNSSLMGHKPVDLLASNFPAVFVAAQADRDVAAGE